MVLKNKLHWFWDYTTRWWFFPSFYLALSFLAAIIGGVGVGIFFAPIFMPMGLLTWPILLTGINSAQFIDSIHENIIIIPFFILFAVGYGVIIHQKHKYNKIIKWLIISLMILILMSFSGCVVGNFVGINFAGSP